MKGDNNMIICDYCQDLNVRARPLRITATLLDPVNPKDSRLFVGKPLFQHEDLRPIDLCDRCARHLKEKIISVVDSDRKTQ